MAGFEINNFIEDQLSCGVCREFSGISNTVSFLCPSQHVFCFTCVANYAKVKAEDTVSIGCPLCRGDASVVVVLNRLGTVLSGLGDAMGKPLRKKIRGEEEETPENLELTVQGYYKSLPVLKREFCYIFGTGEKELSCISITKLSLFAQNFEKLKSIFATPPTEQVPYMPWKTTTGSELRRATSATSIRSLPITGFLNHSIGGGISGSNIPPPRSREPSGIGLDDFFGISQFASESTPSRNIWDHRREETDQENQPPIGQQGINFDGDDSDSDDDTEDYLPDPAIVADVVLQAMTEDASEITTRSRRESDESQGNIFQLRDCWQLLILVTKQTVLSLQRILAGMEPTRVQFESDPLTAASTVSRYMDNGIREQDMSLYFFCLWNLARLDLQYVLVPYTMVDVPPIRTFPNAPHLVQYLSSSAEYTDMEVLVCVTMKVANGMNIILTVDNINKWCIPMFWGRDRQGVCKLKRAIEVGNMDRWAETALMPGSTRATFRVAKDTLFTRISDHLLQGA